MNKSLLTGLVLQGVALLVFAFGERLFYAASFLAYLLIGVPLYLLGVYFVFGANIPLWAKLAINGWWLTIPLYALLAYQWERLRYTPKVYLVDENYRGGVAVDFNEPNGVSPVMTNDTLVLRIPGSGTLKSAFRLPLLPRVKEGPGEWYYVSKTGHRTRLPLGEGAEPAFPESAARVVVQYMGSEYSPDGQRIDRLLFFIGTTEEWAQWISQGMQTFGNQTR
ncbi:MAG TPA: hypothetical protein VF646_19350 [Cytophagales bacterium]|jgi:hypothetical protein